MDAVTLARALAEPGRRQVVAALVLGAHHLDEVRRMTALDARTLTTAVAALDKAGLVVHHRDSGDLHLVEAAFSAAARSTAGTATAETLPEGVDADAAKVLRAFVKDGRITQIPMQRAKRLVLLDLLAQEFEPGLRYREPQVNLILGKWHADTAAWRRYLVDEGFLDRESREYWRTGGTFSP